MKHVVRMECSLGVEVEQRATSASAVLQQYAVVWIRFISISTKEGTDIPQRPGSHLHDIPCRAQQAWRCSVGNPWPKGWEEVTRKIHEVVTVAFAPAKPRPFEFVEAGPTCSWSRNDGGVATCMTRDGSRSTLPETLVLRRERQSNAGC